MKKNTLVGGSIPPRFRCSTDRRRWMDKPSVSTNSTVAVLYSYNTTLDERTPLVNAAARSAEHTSATIPTLCAGLSFADDCKLASCSSHPTQTYGLGSLLILYKSHSALLFWSFAIDFTNCQILWVSPSFTETLHCNCWYGVCTLSVTVPTCAGPLATRRNCSLLLLEARSFKPHLRALSWIKSPGDLTEDSRQAFPSIVVKLVLVFVLEFGSCLRSGVLGCEWSVTPKSSVTVLPDVPLLR